jgi:hypothetical protein
MINFLNQSEHNLLAVAIIGKLNAEDERSLDHKLTTLNDTYGKLQLYVDLTEAEGIDFGALWQDIRNTLKHFNNIERIAVVGDQGWERFISGAAELLTPAECKFFYAQDHETALAWLRKYIEPDTAAPTEDASAQ